MEQREAPCAHCKKIVQYPAEDVGMPFTCSHCHLTFDLPDGRPARARAPKSLKTMCPKCSHVTEYLEAVAGHVIACPECATKIQLPGGAEPSKNPMLELQDEEPEERPAARSSKPQGVIRGKKGFGRAIVPMSGPRRGGPTGDPHRARLIMQAVVLLIIAGVLAGGGYLLFHKTKKDKIDEEANLKRLVEDYIHAVNYDDAGALAELSWGTPDSRQELARGLQEKFKLFQFRIDEYQVLAAAVKDDGDALVRMKWTFTVTDRAKKKSKSWPEEREMGFRKQGGRWVVVRALNFPTAFND